MTKTLSRFAILPFLALALATGPCSAQGPVTLPITGNLGTLAGTPEPDAYITIALMNCTGGQPQITGYHGIVGTTYQFVADTNGNINGGVWPNDLITCSGTTGGTKYALSLYDPSSNQIGTTQCFAVVSTQGTWNINTQGAISCSGGPPPSPSTGSFGNLNSSGFFAGANGTFSGTLGVTGGITGALTGHASLDLALTGGTVTGPAVFNGGATATSVTTGNLTANVNNWQNPLYYGIGSNQSATTVTATASSGSGSLTLSGAGDFVAKQGVMILHGGPTCGSKLALGCPTGPTPTVTPQGTPGSTTYTYKLACIDGLGGIGIAGTGGTTTTGSASLAGVVSGTTALSGNFNQVTWTGATACREVAIYRNDILIGSQWSGAGGTQTFNDVGLTSWTNRDLPVAPPGAALNDNYQGILQTVAGTAATVLPTLGNSVTTALMYHDDAPLIQAAINISPYIDIPQGNYVVRYPINYTKHTASFTYAGEVRGNISLQCDTGDICFDTTGSQNIKFTDINFQTGAVYASPIALYLSRDTSNGDLAQQIVTDHCSFITEVQNSNTFGHAFGGRGYTGIYNHAAEIQANLYDQFEDDRWMVLTSNNVDNVASPFSVTDDRGSNSMSQVDCYSCRGGGYVFAELEGAFTVNFENGYGLGGFLDLRHPWGFEVDAGESARVKIHGFRVEGKNGLFAVAAGAQFQEPYVWVDLYRVQSAPYASATTPMIYLNNGAVMLNAAYIQIDDYGGSGAHVAPIVDGVNCSVQNSMLFVGIWQSQGSCNGGTLTGASNTILGNTQNDFALTDTYTFTASLTTPSWVKLGTWINHNQPAGNTLRVSIFGGYGFTSTDNTQGEADLLIRMGNQTAAPNLAGAAMIAYGSSGATPGNAAYDQLKVVATGGSTSITNGSWDIYIHETASFTGGNYKVTKAVSDQWIPSGMTGSDPGSASSSLFVGQVNIVALQGAPASFTSLTVPGTTDGCATWASGLLGSTGTACGAGGGGGVSSINGTAGAYTFTGAGVSCTTTTCTFSGTGSGVTSVALTVPAWLTVAGSPVTSSGTLAVTATGAQTANQFLATPNGSTGAVGLRAIVAADVPTLNQNTSGTAAGLSGTPAIVVSTAKATTFYTNLDFCVNGGTWPSCTACTTAATVDPANGNNQTIILTAGSTCALTFTQPVSKEVAIQLTVIQSSSGGFNGLISGCTWPGGAGGGVAPVITPSSGAVDVVWAKLDSVHSRCTVGQAFN